MPTSNPYMGWTSAAHAFRRNQAKQARDLAQRVQVYEQIGFVTLVLPLSSDSGEGSFALDFTYAFIEKPTFHVGHELAPNQQPVSTKYPQVTTTCGDWNTGASGYSAVWLGVVLYVAVTASAGQSFIVHYSFTGKAMSSLAVPYNDPGADG